MSAGAAVEIARIVDRRVPMTLHGFGALAIIVFPDDFVFAGRHFEEGAADAVGFADEHLVAGNDGHAGVDAFELLVAPRIMEIDLSSRGLESKKAAAAKGKAPAPIADRSELERGITGQLVADLVSDFAGELVEGDDPGAIRLNAIELPGSDLVRIGRAPTNHDDQQIAFDDRRAADAEEILNDAKILVEIFLPQRLAIGQAAADQ